MEPEIAQKYVQYNAEYSVMICIQHKYALTPNEGICRHFQQFHKGIPEAARAAIKAFAKSVLVKGPDEVLMPLTEMSPVKGLEVWKDGFKCFHYSCQGYGVVGKG